MSSTALPWIVTLAAAGLFLAADRVWDFHFGLRTYWPVGVVLWLAVRLGVEARQHGGPAGAGEP